MADTERTIATLTGTTFVDGQAAGAITPQDVRDLIVSMATLYGDCYISSAATTTIAGVDTWTKIAGTTLVGSNLRNVSMPASNRLRNDGDQTRVFRVEATLEYIMANAAKEMGFGFALDGTIEANTEIRDDHLVAADSRLVHLSALVSVAANSYVEVFAINRTDGNNITVNRMVFIATGMPT